MHWFIKLLTVSSNANIFTSLYEPKTKAVIGLLLSMPFEQTVLPNWLSVGIKRYKKQNQKTSLMHINIYTLYLYIYFTSYCIKKIDDQWLWISWGFVLLSQQFQNVKKMLTQWARATLNQIRTLPWGYLCYTEENNSITSKSKSLQIFM